MRGREWTEDRVQEGEGRRRCEEQGATGDRRRRGVEQRGHKKSK